MHPQFRRGFIMDVLLAVSLGAFASIAGGTAAPQLPDAHRGMIITDANGRYRVESNFPGGSSGGIQPHIHLRVAAPGYRTLNTIYFPEAGATTGTLDLVLEPEV